jgi:hypothetical protein
MTPTFSTIKTVEGVAVVEVFVVVAAVAFAVEAVVAFVAVDALAAEVVAVVASEADTWVVEEEEAIIHIIRSFHSGAKDDRDLFQTRIYRREEKKNTKMSISNNVNYYLEKNVT